MSETRAIQVLINDGFDRKFAEKALEWFAGHPAEFRKAVNFLGFVRSNEYLIRNS